MPKSLVSISLKNNSERERVSKELLERVLSKYHLEKWVLCRDVTIEQDAGGKAFPLITLSAWKDSEEGILAQFLHEQIHWIEKGKKEEMGQAIEELKSIFPDAPINKPEGGGSQSSTYKHLIVCRLEFLVLRELLGEDRAKGVVLENKNYTWIRRTIIERGADIDFVIKKHFSDMI